MLLMTAALSMWGGVVPCSVMGAAFFGCLECILSRRCCYPVCVHEPGCTSTWWGQSASSESLGLGWAWSGCIKQLACFVQTMHILADLANVQPHKDVDMVENVAH